MWETLCSWLIDDDDVMYVLTTSNVHISMFCEHLDVSLLLLISDAAVWLSNWLVVSYSKFFCML